LFNRPNVLLVGLTESLVGLLGLFFEQLQASLKRLVLGAVLSVLIGRLLEVLNGGLELLDLSLKYPVLVLQRGDFLFLGEVLLLEGFDLSLKLLNLGGSVVGLLAQLAHFLGSKH
jgi:hypothetical protein